MIRFGTNHMDWNLDDMLVALGKELDVLEGHFPIMQSYPNQGVGGRHQDQANRPRQPDRPPQTASAPIAFKDGKCAFCQGNHKSEKCKKAKELRQCKTFLIKNGRCCCCLKAGHRAFKCRDKLECTSCKGNNHPYAICPSLAPKEPWRKPSTPMLDPTASV